MITVTDLSRRLMRAAEAGRGIKLSVEDMDMLASLGALALAATAADAELREKAKCRDIARKRNSIKGVNSGSTGTGKPMDLCGLPSSQSGGTTQDEAASEAHQRALAMFQRQPSGSMSDT